MHEILLDIRKQNWYFEFLASRAWTDDQFRREWKDEQIEWTKALK